MADSGASFEKPDALKLTPQEKAAFKQLFAQADQGDNGVITGEVAVKFLEKTNVPQQVLGEIWQIADSENRGFLTSSAFAVCCRLIGHYQAGRNPELSLAYQPGPIPKFEGISLASAAPPPSGPPPGALQPQLSGQGPIRVPPLMPEKAAMYAKLFEDTGARGGFMQGDQAKSIFEKAQLPNEILGRIWNLADTEERGALSLTEFIIAMHLLASFKSGTMPGVPNSLPAGLYEAAARRGAPPPARAAAGPAGAAASPIPRQFSGSSQPRTQSPLSRTPYGVPPSQAPPTDWDWDISPQEKAQYDREFNKLFDARRTGYILGNEAVVFFSNSGLSEEQLAQIWDLSDIRAEGRLNSDEFAVAMHLIRMQRGKTQSVLPQILPQRLVPPSMRNQKQVQESSAPAFDNAQFQGSMSKSAADDLFGLDALTSPPSQAQAQGPQSTGGSTGAAKPAPDPFGSQPSSPRSPQQSQFLPSASAGSFKPFKPTSAFGQGLQTQGTGGSHGSAASAPRGATPQQQPTAYDDLLGDNDPEVSQKLTQDTTELANMSNQIGVLRTQMEETQKSKAATENDLNRTSAQKRDLEARLSQFRAQYEQEVKNSRALQDRLKASKEETEKLRREYAMVEGAYQDLQNQTRQVGEALAADQRENTALKHKIAEINGEIANLKPQLEKMRSDARQQKGLVAINKKQLATNEGERDKMKSEISDLTKNAADSARASPAPEPASVASPALSDRSQSTNPFFRKSPQPSFDNTMSPGGFSRAAAPQSRSAQDSFDNFFNTADFKSPQASAPPQASFGRTENAPNFAQGSSLTSSDEPMIPTPSASPPLSTSYQDSPSTQQSPALPESRQAAVRELPIRETVPRTESYGSSARVGTPSNRTTDPGAETPTTAASMPLPSDSSRALDRKDSNRPEMTNFFDRPPNTSPTIGSASIPGAFPEPTPVQRSNSKSDFDAAFANYGAPAKQQERQTTGSSANGSVGSGSAAKFQQEFPPIQQIEDDESDSSDDDKGFDDNFASPERKKEAEAPMPDQIPTADSTLAPESANSAAAAAAGSALGDPFAQRPSMQHLGSAATTSTTATDLPTPTAQKSPPTYGQTMEKDPSNEQEQNANFPPEFSGLLPSREDPTQHAHSVPVEEEQRAQSSEDLYGAPVRGGSGQGQALFGGGSSPPPKTSSPMHTESGNTDASDIFHSAVGTQNNSASDSQPPQFPRKSGGDGFDDFDDLEDANEGDNEDDDMFHPANSRHEGFDEYNPVFDSPAASKTTTMGSSGPTPKGTTNQQPSKDAFGDDFERSIDDAFGNNSSSNAVGASSSTNWDDLFPSAPSAQNDSASPRAFSFDADDNANTPARPAANTHPEASDTLGDIQPPPGPPPGKAGQLPQLEQAISPGTEHDDPLLTGLTSKGFPRAEALSALERYDYDTKKAMESLQEPMVSQLMGMGYKRDEAEQALKAYDWDLGKAADYLTSR